VGLLVAVEKMFAEEFSGPSPALLTTTRPARLAVRDAADLPISLLDAMIAAIARSRGAAVATHNARNFERCGIQIIIPWTA
jgi:hypothetical protein